ncbi:hypothetical protein ACH4F6_21610 [Streptomyces sp. NPDC017936]|uniref:hypothetical protein n=1 Tax=Streptomyces sp. NPDC017936 TaxID=3365016 RepID=UPI0037ABE4CD
MTAMPRRAAALCLAALAVAVLGGCTEDEEPEAAPSSSGPSVSAAPGSGRQSASPAGDATAGPGATAVDRGDPETVAAAFVDAYVRQDWTVDGPRAYLERIEPYATAAYLEKLRDTSSDRCDVTCAAAKKGGVSVSADAIETVIPDEAPRTPTEVWVQVTYVERTSWSNGGDGNDTGMNLKLVKSDGTWLVDARMGSE